MKPAAQGRPLGRAVPRPSLPPGTKIDRYLIDEMLGTGGFGTVYRGHHSMLGHAVAVKLLHPDHLGSATTVERFFREAKAAAAIGSPHIAQVLDCGTTPEGLPFLVMELLEGRTLQDALDQDGIVPVDRALGIAVQVLDGLAAAHAAGIVHRDLKPANVFVTRDPDGGGDFVKLLDFGISKVRTANASQITNTGVVMGTPIFMAPEQFRSARDVDGRADVYAASVVFYLMLSGRVPFKGDTYEEMVVKVNTETPAPLAMVAPRVPAAIAQVIDRGLARDRDARWQSAEEYALALRVAAGGERTPVMRPVVTHRGTGSMGRGGTVPSGPPSAMPTPLGQTAPRADPYGETAHTPRQRIPETLTSAPPSAMTAPSQGPSRSQPPQPAWVSGPGVPYVAPAVTPVQSGVTPSAVSATIPEEPQRAGWVWLLLLAPVAALVGAGIVLGVLALLGRSEASAPASQPVPAPMPAPAPVFRQPQQLPAWPQQPPQPEQPQAMPAPAVGPPSPSLPTTPPPATARAALSAIVVHEPFTVGEVDDAAIREVLRLARPGMDECRANQDVRVRVQLFVRTSGHISLAGPDAENPGPDEVARCVAARIRDVVPEGWQPGDGIVKVDVDLPGR